MPLFDRIVGQELALAVLRQALATGPTHAYLFAGPKGVGKADAALEFAAALCCPDGGCGECDTCRRVREGIHPDVEVVAPEGSLILVDQIREINRDIALRPFEAKARVYVLLQAESMNKEAANAFLKTLEEPPPHAYLILVTDTPDELLPTIVSRCQRVPFSRTPSALVARHLGRGVRAVRTGRAGLLPAWRRATWRTGASLASSPAARAHRAQLLAWARGVPEASLLDVELMVDELMASVEARAGAARAKTWTGCATAPWSGRPTPAAARGSRRRTSSGSSESGAGRWPRGSTRPCGRSPVGTATWRRWPPVPTRPCSTTTTSSNSRRPPFPGMLPGYLAAVGAARRAMRRFRYNVDARCILEDMVLAMKEALP